MRNTVLLVDDHDILRAGVRAMLEKEEHLDVVGEANNGRAAVEMVRRLKPDVVIMDIAMPELNGISATRQITSDCPGTRVITLSMHSDKRFVKQMLQAGAAGYLLKEKALDELARAIREVLDGNIYLSPGITGALVRDIRQSGANETLPAPKLTDREREVLQLVAEGQTTKSIADTLHVSVKTIESHRKQIMDKLALRSVAELTKYAIREGVTSLDD